jgi:hypothetical protein
MKCVVECLALETLADKEISQFGLTVEMIALLVNGLKYGLMKGFGGTERYGRVIGPGVQCPKATKGGWHTFKGNLILMGLAPSIQACFKFIAMRATIPEELDHMDLTLAGRRSIVDGPICDPFL